MLVHYRAQGARHTTERTSHGGRFILALVLLSFGGIAIFVRFFQLQLLEYKSYKVLASDQHEVQAALVPRRGTIYVRDRIDGTLYPIAKDRDAWQVYAVPREMKEEDKKTNAQALAPILGITEQEIFAKIGAPTSTYTVLAKDVSLEQVEQLRQQRYPGIGIAKGLARLYPEQGLGGHVLGFVQPNDQGLRVGKYGVEGFENEALAGRVGSIVAEKDAAGRRLTIGTIDLQQAKDGSDLVLTIDRSIQFKACEVITRAVKTYQADSASIIVMDPETGAILAMCGAPDFDPAMYGKTIDYSAFNNPATFYVYEPGSIFKPITVAAGIDAGKITPQTTYTDKGEEKIDDFTVRNSDKKAHGVQTMTQVLEKSLNLGTIFIQRQLGKEAFREYVTRFGFGKKTGLELNSEVKGDISPLGKKGVAFAATASYGQGISTTPIQMVTAFAALGNGGKLLKPYIVREVLHPDGTQEKTQPLVVDHVIGVRASRLVSAMMVNVVENGHGKQAGVPGYYVAGKTGTAQVPKTNGKGYMEDATIGSFAGYAPAQDPKFVMLVKVDHPRTEQYAEMSAAPVWGEMAKFLLAYLEVPPERAIKKPVPVKAPQATSTPAVVPQTPTTP